MSASQPTLVQPGIYISSIDGLKCIKDLGITHVVSIINWSPDQAQIDDIQGCSHLHLDIEDVAEADLLSHLPKAISFISDALNGSDDTKVLIHCNQGVSRSASVAIAYIMSSQSLSFDEALATVKSNYPSTNPNSGFLEQLKLFQEMGCTLQQSSKDYKRFLLEQAGHHYYSTGQLADTTTQITDSTTSTLYRCRKCRTLVATSDNVVETETGAGQTAFAWKKRDKFQPIDGQLETSTEDGSLFTEPLSWMKEAVEGAVQGKLYCLNPKCNARLGSFNWSGAQTSTGSWVTPAFQLHQSKLDSIAPVDQSIATSMNGMSIGSSSIRQPKLLSNTKRFTHLVLDCDGVLVDSEVASCHSLYLSIKQVTGFEIPHKFPEDYTPVFGMDVTNCCKYYKQAYNLNDAPWDNVEELGSKVTAVKDDVYKDLTKDGVKAFPGVRELVAEAHALGMGVAVASSGAPEKIQHNLGTAGLLDVFDPYLIVSAKYVAEGKPAPDVYLEALKRLGCVDASKALVIEDAVNGLKAGKSAGCFTVAVSTSLPESILKDYAHHVYPDISHVSLKELQQHT